MNNTMPVLMVDVEQCFKIEFHHLELQKRTCLEKNKIRMSLILKLAVVKVARTKQVDTNESESANNIKDNWSDNRKS